MADARTFLIGCGVRCVYVLRALSKIRKPKLMDIVSYKGADHQLIQGVQNPYWDLLPLDAENMARAQRHVERHVHINDFRLRPLWRRGWFSLRSTYRFFRGYWLDIDMMRLERGECTWRTLMSAGI